MGLLDGFLRTFGVAKSSVKPDSLEKAKRGEAKTPTAIGAVEKDGFLVPLRNPKELVSLVTKEWMVGTAIDRRVTEVTREGYEFVLKDGIDDAQREALEKAELAGIKALFDKPNDDGHDQVAFPMKDIIKSIAWYHVVTADAFLEVLPDILGRPTQLYPLPSEYMRERAPDKPKQLFCPDCYKADTIYSEGEAACRECGSPLVETVWALVDDSEKVVARWTYGEIVHHQPRAYGGRKRGFSTVDRVWYIAQILRWMERYQFSAYANNTSADKIIACPKMSQGDVNAMFGEIAAQKEARPYIRKNLVIGVTDPPQVIDLLDSLVDLDAVNLAQFYREAIGINFGVSLNMLGIQTPGKLGKETETMEASYDTIEEDQADIEELFNTRILTNFKEIKSFEFHLKSPKRDDLLRKAQIESMKAQTLKQLQDCGADARLNKDGDIEILGWKKAEPVRPLPGALFPPPAPGTIRPGEATPPMPLEALANEPNAEIGMGGFNLQGVKKGLTPRDLPKGQVPAGITKAEQKLDAKMADIQATTARQIAAAKTQAELQAMINAAMAEMEAKLAREALAFERDYYQEVLEREATKEGWDPAFQQVDEYALDYLSRDPQGIIVALENYTGKQRDMIIEVFKQAEKSPEGLSLSDLKKQLATFLEKTPWELSRIARTETTRITNLARMNRWTKVGIPDDRYELVIAHDERVCEHCRTVAEGGTIEVDGLLKAYHGNPYTFSEMRNIGGDGTIHGPNCRCAWARIPASYMKAGGG